MLAALLSLVLLLAACGGDDGGGEEAGGDTGGTDTATEAGGETEAGATEGGATEGGATEGGTEAAGGVEGNPDEDFYAGKEIEIIVPFSTGGGTDTQARFMAPFLPDAVPGNPSVGVVNIEGAGGTIGNNEFALSRNHEDATSVLFSSASSFLPWVFQDPALQLDYTNLVGALGVQTGGVAYVNTNTGIESTEQFAEMAPDVQWVAGEQTPNSLGLLWIIAYDLLGLEFQTVMGYEGRGPIRVAFEQGEVTINWDTTSVIPENVQPLFDSGTAVPVFTAGQVEGGEVVRDPAFPDLPHVGEVYEEIHGEAPSGELWDAYRALVLSGFTLQKVMWLHQDAPDDAVADLREGFAAMVENEQFQEEGAVILELENYELITGDAVDEATAELLAFPEETKDFLLDYIVENYEYPDPRTG